MSVVFCYLHSYDLTFNLLLFSEFHYVPKLEDWIPTWYKVHLHVNSINMKLIPIRLLSQKWSKFNMKSHSFCVSHVVVKVFTFNFKYLKNHNFSQKLESKKWAAYNLHPASRRFRVKRIGFVLYNSIHFINDYFNI